MTVAAPTYADLFAVGKASAQGDRPDLTFGDGDLSEMLVAASAAMGETVATYAAGRFRALTTDGDGQDLTDYAEDRWQIVRVAASPAVVPLTFSRASFAAGGGTLGAGFIVATQRTADGVEMRFTLDAPVTFGATDLTKTGNATCTVNGPDGNVAATKINRMISTAFDTTIQVSNAAAAAGGALQQTDDSLRADVRAFPQTVREATLGALAYHLGRVSGVANVAVLEEVVSGQPTGIVNVYVSDVSGNANDALMAAVIADLPNHKPAGAAVNINAGSTVTQTIAVQLTLAAGLSPSTAAAIASDVVTAIVNGVNGTAQGQLLERSEIQRWGRNVDPDTIRGLTVVTPSTDVQPAANVAIRITSANVTVS